MACGVGAGGGVGHPPSLIACLPDFRGKIAALSRCPLLIAAWGLGAVVVEPYHVWVWARFGGDVLVCCFCPLCCPTFFLGGLLGSTGSGGVQLSVCTCARQAALAHLPYHLFLGRSVAWSHSQDP